MLNNCINNQALQDESFSLPTEPIYPPCGLDGVFVYPSSSETLAEVSSDDFQSIGSFGITPPWKRYALTVPEAAEYYHIGENKLRRIAEDHRDEGFVLLNGNRVLFKRKMFEEFLDNATLI